jgi:hypothetical protein
MAADQTKPIGAKDILRYLTAQSGASIGCHGCGSLKVSFWDEPREKRRFVCLSLPFGSNELGDAQVVDIVYGECENCHALRFYNRKPIADWVAEHPV